MANRARDKAGAGRTRAEVRRTPAARTEAILDLQRTAGNTAVQRLIGGHRATRAATASERDDGMPPEIAENLAHTLFALGLSALERALTTLQASIVPLLHAPHDPAQISTIVSLAGLVATDLDLANAHLAESRRRRVQGRAMAPASSWADALHRDRLDAATDEALARLPVWRVLATSLGPGSVGPATSIVIEALPLLARLRAEQRVPSPPPAPPRARAAP